MAKRKPIKESPSPSASTRKASSTRYDTQFNPVDTTKGIVKGLGQALFNAGTGRNGGIVGVGKGVVQSFAGTASRVDDYAVRALNATGIKKATPVALQSAKRNTYGYETADLLNVLGVKAGVSKGAGAIKSGRVVNPIAAVKNIVNREQVIVVGTSTGYPTIVPTVPNVVNQYQQLYPKLKNTPVRWGFDPAQTRSARELTESVSQYSDRWLPNSEIVVGRVPKSSVNNEPVMPGWGITTKQQDAIYKIRQGNLSEINNPSFRSGAVASTSPAKIVSRVSPIIPRSKPPTNQRKPLDVLEQELIRAIRRAGGKVPKKK